MGPYQAKRNVPLRPARRQRPRPRQAARPCRQRPSLRAGGVRREKGFNKAGCAQFASTLPCANAWPQHARPARHQQRQAVPATAVSKRTAGTAIHDANAVASIWGAWADNVCCPSRVKRDGPQQVHAQLPPPLAPMLAMQLRYAPCLVRVRAAQATPRTPCKKKDPLQLLLQTPLPKNALETGNERHTTNKRAERISGPHKTV